MIGLDTNVLVRYLAQDDPKQSPRATEILEQKLTKEEPGFLSTIVLVETCWVLLRLYKVAPKALIPILEGLFAAAELQLEHRQEAWQALQLTKTEGTDFADALIGFVHKAAGCDKTLTFDKNAAKNSLFELVR